MATVYDSAERRIALIDNFNNEKLHYSTNCKSIICSKISIYSSKANSKGLINYALYLSAHNVRIGYDTISYRLSVKYLYIRIYL